MPFDVTFEGERQDPTLPAQLAAEPPASWPGRSRAASTGSETVSCPRTGEGGHGAYRTSQDHLGRFIEECCVVSDTYVTAKAMREAYNHGARSRASDPGAPRPWRGADRPWIRHWSGGRGNEKARTWLGIGLVSDGGERMGTVPPLYA